MFSLPTWSIGAGGATLGLVMHSLQLHRLPREPSLLVAPLADPRRNRQDNNNSCVCFDSSTRSRRFVSTVSVTIGRARSLPPTVRRVARPYLRARCPFSGAPLHYPAVSPLRNLRWPGRGVTFRRFSFHGHGA